MEVDKCSSRAACCRTACGATISNPKLVHFSKIKFRNPNISQFPILELQAAEFEPLEVDRVQQQGRLPQDSLWRYLVKWKRRIDGSEVGILPRL